MRLESGAFGGAYSYRSRMEDSDPGTNPEELLGAAHAGCAVSKALAGVEEITLEAKLLEHTG